MSSEHDHNMKKLQQTQSFYLEQSKVLEEKERKILDLQKLSSFSEKMEKDKMKLINDLDEVLIHNSTLQSIIQDQAHTVGFLT